VISPATVLRTRRGLTRRFLIWRTFMWYAPAGRAQTRDRPREYGKGDYSPGKSSAQIRGLVPQRTRAGSGTRVLIICRP
jgi:hypothetical protein